MRLPWAGQVWWWLALGWSGGVNGLMEYFQRELVDTALHCGVNRIAELAPEHVRHVSADRSVLE
jgi:isopentenyl diphosphate isomerase/L-lactate dehydrogenase-like FMN-dependent dehydrogenase